MRVQIREILENFPDLLQPHRGSADTGIDSVQTGSTASSGSLIFVSNRAQFKEAVKSPSQHWVVSSDLANEVPASVPVVLVSPNPYLAMALVGRRFFPLTRAHIIIQGSRIHESAQLSTKAHLGRDCIIGPGAVIGDDVVLGDRCIVGANSVLEPGVKVGAGSYIHPLVFIGHSCEIGQRCEIKSHSTIGSAGFGFAHDAKGNHYHITHYGKVVLEDDVYVGASVQIDRGTFEDSVIGAGTKIDNHCHFGHNIRIGRNTLITGGVIAAGSTELGNNCVVGGRSTFKGHLTVCDNAHFAGLSGINKDVTRPGAYGGLPLQTVQKEMRTRAALKELPNLIKQVRQIFKHLGLAADPAAE